MSKRPIALVADDDADIRRLMKAVLDGRGIEAAVAKDGEAALEIIRQQTFDVVISDNDMPKLTGLGLFKEACKLRPELERRFIFVSGTMERSTETEHCPIFVKPCSLPDLVGAINHILENYSAE